MDYDQGVFTRRRVISPPDAYFVYPGAGSGSMFLGFIVATTMVVTEIISGTISTGTTVTGTGVAGGTTISGQTSGVTGQAGSYTVNNSQTVAPTTLSAM
jgi:hypothetical protein